MSAPTFAPFCSNPACSCAAADTTACDSYARSHDSAGQERCACCGNTKAAHVPTEERDRA